ncbi:SGNH/GDSL hydrolase family protein [Mucilaginibacter terrae]|uniref:Lysophospholipase L1-like esterase n=1 Tax=Mucilaginibacter terrae TaxID=1955052 RepID=A0ABU3GT85_9SPHI|nr:SGNH/GDSL hydrolase family protein [Mucilaginibacter terrae]MDT3402972.1 lysophospholipase L1-like esterase [Mucilaginibacter terrae]
MKFYRYFLLVLFLIAATSFIPQKQISWTAIGDSITYLNDHTNETGDRITKGYLTRVTEQLPYLHYTNQGHNGWTVVRIAKEIEKLNLQKADVYTVFLGTNDWWHGGKRGTMADYQNSTGLQTVYGAYRIITDKLKSLNPQARVILITPMQRGDFVYIRNPKNNAWGSYKEKEGQTLEQFAEAVKAIAKLENYEVVDLYHNSKLDVKYAVKFKRLKDSLTHQYQNFKYPAYTNIPFNAETDGYPYPPEAINMTYDGLHPSDKGNEIIAGMLIKVMKKIK